jgi:2-oxo-3-hexenedioate decarboxylase
MSKKPRVRAISDELLSLLGTGRQVVPFSQRYENFGLAEAYEVVTEVRRLREAIGDLSVGRKIGFTNRNAWTATEIAAPIWNYVFDRTVSNGSQATHEFRLLDFPEPRVEPEIVLHLGAEPAARMSDGELMSCIDWMAPAYEIVYSIFPNWVFGAADAAAAFGLHAGLVLGAKRPVEGSHSSVMNELSNFSIELNCGETARRGSARDILGGPLAVLRQVIEEIARYPQCEPLRQGELITTGTLTEAMPAVPSAIWNTRFTGIGLHALRMRLA